MSKPSKVQRTIVVSGANGLIGQVVCRQLCDQAIRVIALIRPRDKRRPVASATYVELDLSVPVSQSLAEIGKFDGMIHLAQEPGWHKFPANAGQIARVNIGSTTELAEAAIKAGASSFVFASSGGIHGACQSPIQEHFDAKTSGNLGFYLDTKVAAERILNHFKMDMRVHILRPFFVYGEGQSDTFLITRLLNSVKNGTVIKAANGCGPKLNPIHADDAARAFCAAIDKNEDVISNVAGPSVVTIAEIATIIGDLTGISAKIEEAGALPGDFVADISTMAEQLHSPEISIRDGLLRMVGSLEDK